MKRNVCFEEGEYGVRAILTSKWQDNLASIFNKKQVAELELNWAKGWSGDALLFLEALKELKAFSLIDWKIKSILPIHHLRELRNLKVSTYCKTPIDFSSFPYLEKCSLEWRKSSDSLFKCHKLKDLYLNSYKGKDTDSFSQLENLETLIIANSPIKSLKGLANLKKIRILNLANLRMLTSLAGIEGLAELEELRVDTCRKITSIEEVRRLYKLRIFHFNNNGPVKTLTPLVCLKRLEAVLFYETTNVLDGNISFLKTIPKLNDISFQNRAHYSNKREEFGEAWFGNKETSSMKESALSNQVKLFKKKNSKLLKA